MALTKVAGSEVGLVTYMADLLRGLSLQLVIHLLESLETFGGLQQIIQQLLCKCRAFNGYKFKMIRK